MKSLVATMMTAAGALGLAVLLTTAAASAQEMTMAQYEGTWELQANGDVKVTRKFTLPMKMYTLWKNGNMHMIEFRNFAGTRSTIEVADKKYEWDDINRTLTLAMTALGLARNRGDHWEAKMVPGLIFSNLDENKKTAYFHFSAQGMIGKVEGKDVVILPKDASKIAWNAEANALTYYTPALKASGGALTMAWWLLMGLCAAAGIVLWGVSFVFKPAPASPQMP